MACIIGEVREASVDGSARQVNTDTGVWLFHFKSPGIRLIKMNAQGISTVLIICAILFVMEVWTELLNGFSRGGGLGLIRSEASVLELGGESFNPGRAFGASYLLENLIKNHWRQG